MSSQETDKEYLMRKAIEDAKSIGVRASARLNGVKRGKLRSRISGSVSSQEFNIRNQKLTVAQEHDLADWVMAQEEGYLPVTKAEIHAFAATIAALDTGCQGLGKNWVDRFLARHPRIKMKPSRLIEAARKLQVTEAGLREYYADLDRKIKEKLVGTNRLYNVDETGVREGETHGGRMAGTDASFDVSPTSPESQPCLSVPDEQQLVTGATQRAGHHDDRCSV